MDEELKKKALKIMQDQAVDPVPIYGTRDGWVTTGEYRGRVNPSRAWYNALWEPKFITQQRVTKVVDGQLYAKWTSITGYSSMVEDSDEDMGAEG